MVRKHPGCGFAPEQVVKVWRLPQSLPQVKGLFLRGIGSEKKVSLRGAWEILRGIPHLSNVTYLLAKEGNTGIHLRLRVLSVISNRTLYLCYLSCESLRA